MKYNYAVIHNGVYYKPGDDVPDDTKKTDTLKEKEPVEKSAPASKAKRGK